jgi:hypothetical protein
LKGASYDYDGFFSGGREDFSVLEGVCRQRIQPKKTLSIRDKGSVLILKAG